MNNNSTKFRVRVYHSYYGCDTGCCGHIVAIDSEVLHRKSFEFTHQYDDGDKRAWARTLAEEVIRREWPKCLPDIDWESLEINDLVGDH